MWFQNFMTNKNNINLPKGEYLYGTRHIIVLLLTLILTVSVYFIFRRKSDKAKNILFNCFGFFFLLWEISTRIVNVIIADTLTFERILEILLPMHICSVMVWVFILAIFTKNQGLINFGAIGGILATLAFLLYPAVGLHQVYINFTNLYSITSHMMGFVCAVSLISLRRTKFEMKKIWQTYLYITIMFCWGAFVNFVIFPGSDYMYMINDPLELGLPFPYQILYLGIISIYILSFYLIPWLKNKINNKRTATTN